MEAMPRMARSSFFCDMCHTMLCVLGGFFCSIALARSPLNKDFRDHAEQQHIAAQQKAALQVSWCTQVAFSLAMFQICSPSESNPGPEENKKPLLRLGFIHFCTCNK